MSELTPDQRLFWKTEQLKKKYMQQGMTKQQALEKVKQQLVDKFPSNYAIGIENGHITIRKIEPTNMGSIVTQAFGGKENALKMLENIKKGFTNAVMQQEGTDDRSSE